MHHFKTVSYCTAVFGYRMGDLGLGQTVNQRHYHIPFSNGQLVSPDWSFSV